MATQAGVVQAVFPEGGLSLDGALRQPKLGLISYIVSGYDPHGGRDVVFIPVGVNYDRVLEDRLLTEAGARGEAGGRASFRVSTRAFLGFIGKGVWLALRGRWHRYGYACVSFGGPISLRAWLAERNLDLRALSAEDREQEIARLGETLMHELERTVPALPVSLVARAMVKRPDEPLTLFELKGHVHALMARLESQGAYIHIPRRDRDYALDVGLRTLLLRRIVLKQGDGTYRLNPAELTLAAYYGNAIAALDREAPLPGLDRPQDASIATASRPGGGEMRPPDVRHSPSQIGEGLA
jgi:glycerol-3-phosphate O-acyltransferase